jgi:hypothetical protein
VGLDGFVDTIVAPVAERTGPGEAFTPFPDIAAFAARIAAAAGKSTNLELHHRLDKLGGNGPILAAALLAGGVGITYVGPLGAPAPHPVFTDFARRAEVFSLGQPATTTAVEFPDGKLMLGQLRPLDEVTLPAIAALLGPRYPASLAEADLIALVNWTMLPHMSAIFAGLLAEVLPALPPRPADRPRHFFFDLADPEKRTRADLREALGLIARFEAHGRVTLGLNLKEAQQVAAVLGQPAPDSTEPSLRASATALRAALALDAVVIHPRDSAACADATGSHWVPGPYTDRPLITTGAGDHFNAGFAHARLLGLPAESCLALGVCTSGHYVRTGLSPGLDELEAFLSRRA